MSKRPCIRWTGTFDGGGYGTFRVPGRRAPVSAHRDVFEKAHGYLPPVVRHSCDHSWCVEITHLLPGTQADNVADMVARGRHVGQPPGERNPQARLTAKAVAEIRASGESTKGLARIYGVAPKTIRRVRQFVTWTDVPSVV